MGDDASVGQPGGGDQNRVRCLYCGANNFPASPNCWQCGRKLQAARTGPSAAASASSTAAREDPGLPAFSAPLSAKSLSGVNPALAGKAAAALGLIFPWVGLPVGMVFLMLDDERKVKLGWATIWWSVLGTILSVLTLVLPFGALWGMLKAFAPHGGAPGGGIPGGLPGGIPTIPGVDPNGFLMLLWAALRL
ncbi:MAG: hypothetical protein M3Y13_15955 [Armatimonadota bacterium]|nr:hypothetical protein [Armatimonadota bacterium]